MDMRPFEFCVPVAMELPAPAESVVYLFLELVLTKAVLSMLNMVRAPFTVYAA